MLHEMGPLVIAVTGMLAIFGGGIRFVWAKISKRITALETKVGHQQDEIDACESRDVEKDKKLHTLGLCLRLLIPEVTRLDPASATLMQVRSLLDQSFPPDPDLPPDMVALIDQIDAARPRNRAPRKSTRKGPAR